MVSVACKCGRVSKLVVPTMPFSMPGTVVSFSLKFCTGKHGRCRFLAKVTAEHRTTAKTNESNKMCNMATVDGVKSVAAFTFGTT